MLSYAIIAMCLGCAFAISTRFSTRKPLNRTTSKNTHALSLHKAQLKYFDEIKKLSVIDVFLQDSMLGFGNLAMCLHSINRSKEIDRLRLSFFERSSGASHKHSKDHMHEVSHKHPEEIHRNLVPMVLRHRPFISEVSHRQHSKGGMDDKVPLLERSSGVYGKLLPLNPKKVIDFELKIVCSDLSRAEGITDQ